jgi:hypothetical protein
MLKVCFSLMLSLGAMDRAFAQNGPAEFSSAPCSTVALGPTDEISHLQRIYLFKGTEQTTQYKFSPMQNAHDLCTALSSLVTLKWEGQSPVFLTPLKPE